MLPLRVYRRKAGALPKLWLQPGLWFRASGEGTSRVLDRASNVVNRET